MKQANINKEILVFTNTSFAKRELSGWKDAVSNESSQSAIEYSSWSGVFDMLPDILNRSERKKLCIWKVNQTEQFVHVELGNTPAPPQYKTSIDPYFFLPLVIYHN